MLNIQRKTFPGGVTFTVLQDGKVIAPHLSGLWLSQVVAKSFGSSLPVLLELTDGTKVTEHVIFRSTIGSNEMGDADRFVDMCIVTHVNDFVFAEVPIISLRNKNAPTEKAVQRISVIDENRLADIIKDHIDKLDSETFAEYLEDISVSDIKLLLQFLGYDAKGTDISSAHKIIADTEDSHWQAQFIAYGLDINSSDTKIARADAAICFLSEYDTDVDDEEEDFDFEDEDETFSDLFDGDSMFDIMQPIH